jgi:RNA polymerase sigma factor (sigma-70 family)
MSPQEQHAIFDRWMADHPGILHRVAGAFADGADRSDLLQELMLAVWKAVPAFQGACQPSTFLYRVAHHAALTWKRNASTYRRHVDRLAAQPVAVEDDAGPARDREMLDLIYAEIRRLPPVDRSLLLLHLDGVGYAGIAEILGLTESNTGTRLTRLKQRLVSTLKEKTHELR